jgi:alpha-1,3-mannosyltransferase
MRVLHLLTNFYPVLGGLESFVLGLTRRLREQARIDARVLCLNRASRGEDRLPEEATVDGVPVRRVDFLDLVYYKPALLPLEELRAADVLHVHGVGANLDYVAATRRLHKRPIVVSTHGGIFHTPSLARVKQLYFRHVIARSLHAADRVVACSGHDRAIFAPIEPRIELIENAVDLPPAGPIDGTRDGRRCLFVGRFAANKRIDLLLRAFAAATDGGRSTDRGRDLQLRLVGPDWQHLGPQLRALAGELGIADHVTFVGPVDRPQLEREYAAAGLLLSASEHEGFGITVIEAMAAGAVPVVNDIPAFHDMITNGLDGFLVDYRDAARAGETIARATTMDLAAVRRAGIERAQHFSWEQQLPKWIELYHALAAKD